MVNKPYGTNAEKTEVSPIEELDSARVLLQYLRVQQHDFLNHIQVILAYLQLNKTQRATEYIEDIISQKQTLTTVYKLTDPEIAACFVGGMTKAAFHQVDLQFKLECQWSLRNDSRRVAGLVTELLHIIIETAASLTDRRVLVKIQEGLDGYFIAFEINGPVSNPHLLEEFETLSISAIELGCSVRYQQTDSLFRITCEFARGGIKDKLCVAEKR